MLRSLLSSVAMIALAGAANAADLPRRNAAPAPAFVQAYSWTGFYVGVNAGYGFGDSDVDTIGLAAGNIANVALNRRPGSVSFDRDGFIGGAQIGYNRQFGSFVAGIEADIQYTDLNGSETFVSTLNDRSVFNSEIEYLGTVRGRLGVAFDRFLVYATGGLAYGEVKSGADFFSNAAGAPLQFVGGKSGVETGWVVGGGVEYALPFMSNALTLKLEYLYYDLGDRDVFLPAIPGVGAGAYSSKFETNGSIVRAGLNFKFSTF